MKKTAFKRMVTALLLVATLSILAAAPASASSPAWYKSKWTAGHGYVVMAGNYSYTRTIRTQCHWYAGGSRWTTDWIIFPRTSKWTTSDAGTWGNRAPTALSCTYRYY